MSKPLTKCIACYWLDKTNKPKKSIFFNPKYVDYEDDESYDPTQHTNGRDDDEDDDVDDDESEYDEEETRVVEQRKDKRRDSKENKESKNSRNSRAQQQEDSEDIEESDGEENGEEDEEAREDRELEEAMFGTKKSIRGRNSGSAATTTKQKPNNNNINRNRKTVVETAKKTSSANGSRKPLPASSTTIVNRDIGDLSKQLLQLSQTPPSSSKLLSTSSKARVSVSNPGMFDDPEPLDNMKANNGQKGNKKKANVAPNSNANNSSRMTAASKTISEPANFKPWSPFELVGLYAIQAKTDITQANFWELVSSQLDERGIHRSAEDCEYRWYLVSSLFCLN